MIQLTPLEELAIPEYASDRKPQDPIPIASEIPELTPRNSRIPEKACGGALGRLGGRPPSPENRATQAASARNRARFVTSRQPPDPTAAAPEIPILGARFGEQDQKRWEFWKEDLSLFPGGTRKQRRSKRRYEFPLRKNSVGAMDETDCTTQHAPQ